VTLPDAGGGVVEGRVVTPSCRSLWIPPDLPEVGGADSVVRDGDLVGLARAIVDDGERSSRGAVEPSSFRVVVADSGESIENPQGRGTICRAFLSLYTKGATAGNWPKGRGKASKFKRVGPGRDEEGTGK